MSDVRLGLSKEESDAIHIQRVKFIESKKAVSAVTSRHNPQGGCSGGGDGRSKRGSGRDGKAADSAARVFTAAGEAAAATSRLGV